MYSGELQGQLMPATEEQRERCIKRVDLNKVYYTDDLAKGDQMVFAATRYPMGIITRC